MKSAVAPMNKSRRPSVSWVRRDSISFLPKQNRSISSPPVPISTDQSHQPSLQVVHIENIRTIDSITNDQQQKSPSTDHLNEVHTDKNASLATDANGRRRSVTWSNKSPINFQQKKSYSESSPLSPIIKKQNQNTKPILNDHSDKDNSLKIINEKDQQDEIIKTEITRPVTVNRIRRSSIHSLSNKNKSINIHHDQINDLTPLDPNIDKYQKLNSNHTVKYHFQTMATISEKQVKNRRRMSFCICEGIDYFKCLGCLFAIGACSLAIAALIFANISYQASLPQTTDSTTTTTSSTSTSTTSSTSTSTTTHTTTSTTTVSTTSTSGTVTTTTTTTSTSMCSTTTMTTVVTVTPLPSSCSTYSNINDGTRLSSYSGGPSSCDKTLFSTTPWVRFTGSSGISLANCPVATQHCGTNATGWYSGLYPAIAGGTTQGTVCFNWLKDTCYWQNNIQITNCNGFYIYALPSPPICDARYCTI